MTRTIKAAEVLTLQQNVLSKNKLCSQYLFTFVLTLQQNVLSKNTGQGARIRLRVLTLQQNVLSKNKKSKRIRT